MSKESSMSKRKVVRQMFLNQKNSKIFKDKNPRRITIAGWIDLKIKKRKICLIKKFSIFVIKKSDLNRPKESKFKEIVISKDRGLLLLKERVSNLKLN